jgi:hypothetical protein
MDSQPESMDRPISASLKATYRALLARGLETGEAANLTAFLHGLPSAGFRWTLPEVEAIVHRRLLYAADQRAAASAAPPARLSRRTTARTATPTTLRPRRSAGTHLIQPPPS